MAVSVLLINAGSPSKTENRDIHLMMPIQGFFLRNSISIKFKNNMTCIQIYRLEQFQIADDENNGFWNINIENISLG